MVEALPLYDWITEGKCVSAITSYCMLCFVNHIPVLLLGQRSCVKLSQRSMCRGREPGDEAIYMPVIVCLVSYHIIFCLVS